ncbi:conserved hypothetical protein [Echinococcus multilocularis]|uniref:Uncharacterized protein n=1 Tax=Echinococcus multilocularis TaxID=6211 RepID=A0A087VWU4_ECHMU|nr:conserved hypothetical protein [Echinococcus multilocularis]
MHQHLLCHSNSKFYLRVRCFEGFSTPSEMKSHTTIRTGDDNASPPPLEELLEHLGGAEGSESPQLLKPKKAQKEHPTERHGISRLRHRVLNATFDPESYHPDDADEEAGASLTTAS